jgi:tetratricopeptide (TPR) repeat protein
MSSNPVETTQSVVITEPNTAEEFVQRAWHLHAEGKLVEAIIDLKKAIEIDENLVDPYYGLGVVYKEQGSTQDAIKAFQKVLLLQAANAQQEKNARSTIMNNLTKSYLSLLENTSM